MLLSHVLIGVVQAVILLQVAGGGSLDCIFRHIKIFLAPWEPVAREVNVKSSP